MTANGHLGLWHEEEIPHRRHCPLPPSLQLQELPAQPRSHGAPAELCPTDPLPVPFSCPSHRRGKCRKNHGAMRAGDPSHRGDQGLCCGTEVAKLNYAFLGLNNVSSLHELEMIITF